MEQPMRVQQKRWDTATSDKLVEMWESGKSAESIAKELNRTVESTRYRIYFLQSKCICSTRRKRDNVTSWSDEDIATLKKLRRLGYKVKEIASIMGRSFNSVNSMANKKMPPKRIKCHKSWTELEEEILKQMYSAGFEIKSISKKLGRGTGSVKNRIKLLGLTNRVYRWSQAEIDLMLDLNEDHVFADLIRTYNLQASKNGYPKRSKSAIMGLFKKLSIQRSRLEYSVENFTADTLALMFGCNPSTVRINLKKGIIPSKKIGNRYVINRKRLKSFLRSNSGFIQRYPNADKQWIDSIVNDKY